MLQETASVCLIMERVIGGNLHQRIKDATRPRISYLEILQVKLLSQLFDDMLHEEASSSSQCLPCLTVELAVSLA